MPGVVWVARLSQIRCTSSWGRACRWREELAELRRAVLAVEFADDAAVGDVDGGEQAGGAVAHVVVGGSRACPASPAGRGRGPASRTPRPRTTRPRPRAGGGRARRHRR